MSQDHDSVGHRHPHNRRRLTIALCITGVFTVVEIVGGLLTRSLALLADAGHMLTDTVALGLAVFAFTISSKPADSRRSFGYHRMQILAAFVNGMTLLAIVIWIMVEAIQRLLDPPQVLGGAMLYVAVAGLLVNIAAFFVLHGGDQHNLNMRGAALHVLGDLLGSIAAIVAAIVILRTGWMPIDPLLSIVVALLIFRSAVFIVRRSAHILLEGTPEGLDIEKMKARIVETVPGVIDVHHVHAWGLTQEKLLLTMHVRLREPTEEPGEQIRAIKTLLKREFNIEHTTIEVESRSCADALGSPTEVV